MLKVSYLTNVTIKESDFEKFRKFCDERQIVIDGTRKLLENKEWEHTRFMLGFDGVSMVVYIRTDSVAYNRTELTKLYDMLNEADIDIHINVEI